MTRTEEFEITFRGTAGPLITGAFEEYRLASSRGHTTVSGPLRDQADLQGVLERIFSLGLEVVDVHVFPSRR
jgi:hypothetical protein